MPICLLLVSSALNLALDRRLFGHFTSAKLLPATPSVLRGTILPTGPERSHDLPLYPLTVERTKADIINDNTDSA